MRGDPNRAMLVRAARQLGPLREEFVLVGGCAAGLLVTEPAAAPVLMTKDVDMVVEVGSYASYARLGRRLRKQGFHEDTEEGAPVCRWRCEDLILDVLPTEESALGFGNRWYGAAMNHAASVELERGLRMAMITAPYFLGTKLEAFASRGKGDYGASHDLEDIIVVVDGREELVVEVAESGEELRGYLARWMNRLLDNGEFQAALSGYLMPDEGSQARLGLVVGRMRAMAGRARTARAVR